MGIETVLFAGLIAGTALTQISNSTKQAKVAQNNAISKADSLKTEGDLAVQEKSKQVRLTAARQTASFLSSGLTLEGTPTDVINETYDVGIADVQNIGKNYQTARMNTLYGGGAQADAFISAGRAQAIGTIAQGAAGYAGASGAGSLFGTQGTASRTLAFGSPSGVGPIQSFGGF